MVQIRTTHYNDCLFLSSSKMATSKTWYNIEREITHLLQLIMMSSGLRRLFSIPIFGWSPRPRKSPGGSMRKFPILSLWLSMIQKPYSCRSRSFSSLIFCSVMRRWVPDSKMFKRQRANENLRASPPLTSVCEPLIGPWSTHSLPWSRTYSGLWFLTSPLTSFPKMQEIHTTLLQFRV